MIDSYTIDVKMLENEFRCPLSSDKASSKQRKPHLINNPVITTCCGNSACLQCFVEEVLCIDKT